MPARTPVRAALATLILSAVACSDAIAPKLDRVRSQIANALTCTVTWVAPVSGLWTEGGMWSTGAVPTAADNVCITAEGNYTVTLRDVRSVNSITVSMPGNADKPKLVIEGFNLGAGFGSSTGRLDVANGFDNYGFVHMTTTGPFPGPAQLIVTNGTFHNHDVAEFRTLPGTAAGRLLQANVVNDGGMVFDATTSGVGNVTNNALFGLGAGVSMQQSESMFTQAGGTFDNAGSYFQNLGTFRLDGGELTGNPPVLQGINLVIGSETAKGTMVVRGQSTIAGNVGAEQVIQIEGWQLAAGWPETPANLTFASAFTNAGIIRLTSTGGPLNGSASLTGPATAAIVNTGRIEVLAGLGNIRAVNANVDNRESGVVDFQVSSRYGQQDGRTTNAGTWKVASGASILNAHAIKFIQNAGTFEIAGAWTQQGGGELQLNGGAITGEPFLNNVAIKIANGSTATGSLVTIMSTLTGDIQPGQRITVTGWPSTHGVLNIPASITNRGTIVMSTVGPQDPGQAQLIMQNGSTLTNAAGARIEMMPGSLETSGRVVSGNLVNDGTIHLGAPAFFHSGTLRTSGPITGGKELRLWSTTFASGSIDATVRNEGAFHVGASAGAAGALTVRNFWMPGGGSFNVDIGGSVPGTDFDKMTALEGATLSGTLNVSTTAGGCAGGESSYEVMAFPVRGGDFVAKNGLNLGGGRTVVTVPGTTNYLLNVSGPPCIPPDATAPVIAPTVTGTLGNNGWYVSNVTVTWAVSDAESPITSKTGCDNVSLTTDNAGITYTCSATSAGGAATESVTIKRDAQAPGISVGVPQPNANGWYGAPVPVTFLVDDAMSGVVGPTNVTEVMATEGAYQTLLRTFSDAAGNTASDGISEIHIDLTAPVVTVTRSPAPDASGWNNTDVTATWTATDARSGIAGSATATHLFDQDGANQSATRTFTDLAGHSASATIAGINIDKTPAPPPPLQVFCSATPNMIWPANNKMVAVQVSISGSGIASYTLLSVTNNETGAADAEGWAIGSADLGGSVRASRLGGASGRTYTLTYEARSTSGAVGRCAATVGVPHDQSGKK